MGEVTLGTPVLESDDTVPYMLPSVCAAKSLAVTDDCAPSFEPVEVLVVETRNTELATMVSVTVVEVVEAGMGVESDTVIVMTATDWVKSDIEVATANEEVVLEGDVSMADEVEMDV